MSQYGRLLSNYLMTHTNTIYNTQTRIGRLGHASNTFVDNVGIHSYVLDVNNEVTYLLHSDIDMSSDPGVIFNDYPTS